MAGEVTKEHLSRKAYIYIRQSSQRQVEQHSSGRQVQYNLTQRAKQLGWSDEHIKIIDEDLGVSATGTKKRTGFEKLINHICQGKIGAIFFLYSSRLARNGKDWYTTIAMCSLFNVLIIDRDTIYDPKLPGDRLSLGMQASFSEFEVNQMQIRAREAIEQKASKGQLFSLLPAGFVLTEDRCHVEQDPDLRIQQAIAGVFTRFEQLGSGKQVTIWYQQNQIELPVRDKRKGFKINWRIPDYQTVYRILTNPLYAGIYVYPKTKTRLQIEDGNIVKKSGLKANKDETVVLIYDLFPAYITKEQYQRNQQILNENAIMKSQTNQGAPRQGTSILTGLVFCAHCSRKLRVRYPASDSYPYYFCAAEVKSDIRKGCLSFGGRYLDSLVVNEIIKVLEPQAIEAAHLAEEKRHQLAQQKQDACYYALEQARYNANRIERQVNNVDPENHLVFDTLTHRWQQALEDVNHLENQYQQSQAQHQVLAQHEKQRLFDLADDLPKVWYHPTTDARIKKRIVRLLIKQVWVKLIAEKTIKATIHWHGGVHTEYEFQRRFRRAAVTKQSALPISIQDLVRKLARVCDDKQIARILNRHGYSADNNQTWSQGHVLQFRQQYNIAPFSQQHYIKQNLVTLKQAAQLLNVSMTTISQMIDSKIIHADQAIKYAPWEIDKHELEKPAVNHYLNQMKQGTKVVFNKNQLPLGLNVKNDKEHE
jgi:DNA invertase Pin-like site-specific DNA recombinase